MRRSTKEEELDWSLSSRDVGSQRGWEKGKKQRGKRINNLS
jgi:hypothetical protein